MIEGEEDDQHGDGSDTSSKKAANRGDDGKAKDDS